MIFEDKILAYLDGSLDEASRAELLHTLSVSPEKRAVLEEHLRLRELMSFGHKPLNVPVLAERALARRIAVLGEEMPHLVEDVTAFTTAGWMAGALQALRSVVSLSSVRFGAGIVAVGAILWLSTAHNNNSATHLPNEHRSAGQSQNLTKGSSLADNATTPQSSNGIGANLSDPNRNSESAQMIGGESDQQVAALRLNVAPAGGSHSSNQRTRAISQLPDQASRDQDSHRSTNSAHSNKSLTELESSASLKDAATPGIQKDNVSSHGAGRNAAAENAALENTADQNATNASGINQDASSGSQSEMVAAINSNPRIRNAEVPSFTLQDLSNAQNSLTRRPIRYEPEEPSSFAGRFSAWVGYGVGQSYGATLAGNLASNSGIQSAPVLGLNYRVGDLFSFGVESGSGNYSRIASSVKAIALTDQPHVYQVQYSASVLAQSTRWIRGTFGLNLLTVDKVHIGTNFGGGMTLSGGSAPMISGSAIATYDLFENIGLNAQLTYSGVWLKPLAPADWRTQITNGSAAVGILSDPVGSRTLFTPALDLFVGLRYTF